MMGLGSSSCAACCSRDAQEGRSATPAFFAFASCLLPAHCLTAHHRCPTCSLLQKAAACGRLV